MKTFVCKWKNFFILNLSLGIFSYFMMISLQLINQLDGIWHSGFGGAGNWERSIGRYLLPYWDELRFGLLTDPFCNVLALVFFILGNIFVLECLKIGPDKFIAYGFSLIFLISTSVGAWLSFRYASNMFAIAYFTSVLAVFVSSSNLKGVKSIDIKALKSKGIEVEPLSIVLGAVCVMVSLATYQAFMNCTCMLILATVLVMILRGSEIGEIAIVFIKNAISIVLGAIFYFSGLQICFTIRDLGMGEYNEVESLSVWDMIVSIPESSGKALYYFRKYFFDTMFRWNRLQEHSIFKALFFGLLLVTFIVAMIVIWKNNKVNAIVFALCVLIMPIATNAVLFIARDSFLSMQMTCGLAFFVAICMVIVFEVFEAVDWNKIAGEKEKPKKIVNVAITAFCILIIYGNYISVQIDQEACREGRTGTITIAGEVLDTLLEMGHIDVGGAVCFVGMPCGNERFMYTEIYPMANNLMQFGNWGTTASSHKQTWEAIYREYFGYYIQACDEKDFDEIIERGDVQLMPCFPRQGSIMKLGDITVVKISNIY